MLIKLWDWEKKWTCTQVFEGHTHYVMQIVINPKDNNTFASASLDRTVKVRFTYNDLANKLLFCFLRGGCQGGSYSQIVILSIFFTGRQRDFPIALVH
jgi:WD40 repeat protein